MILWSRISENHTSEDEQNYALLLYAQLTTMLSLDLNLRPKASILEARWIFSCLLCEHTETEDEDANAEITRCICGSQEYPFPDADVKDRGFIIYCERCNVWQYGHCVVLMSEKETSHVYFFEECRPDLHVCIGSLGGCRS